MRFNSGTLALAASLVCPHLSADTITEKNVEKARVVIEAKAHEKIARRDPAARGIDAFVRSGIASTRTERQVHPLGTQPEGGDDGRPANGH